MTPVSDLTAARALLLDAFTRIHDNVADLTDGLEPATARFRPDPESNSITWLIWHLSRVQDDHVSGLAGTEQVWPRWRDRFALPLDDPDATGYGMSAADVGRVQAPAELLAGYHADVHEATRSYLDQLTDSELERVVDENWDPPVTAAVRLMSVIEDADMHLGQAAYVQGIADRARRA